MILNIYIPSPKYLSYTVYMKAGGFYPVPLSRDSGFSNQGPRLGRTIFAI